MSLAPPNKRPARRDRKDTGKRDRGGKTTARFQLAREVIARLLRGRGVGSRSGVERKLASMEGALGRGSGRPSRGFRRSGLGFVDEQVAYPQGKRPGHCESTGAPETRWNRLREEEKRLVPDPCHPSQPALASWNAVRLGSSVLNKPGSKWVSWSSPVCEARPHREPTRHGCSHLNVTMAETGLEHLAQQTSRSRKASRRVRR